MEHEVIGICPICEREMWKGSSVDKHHLVPKCRGGKKTEYMHKICHRKIHSIWKEKELEKKFNDHNLIIENEIMQIFIAWIKKKEPDYYDRHEQHNRKK